MIEVHRLIDDEQWNTYVDRSPAGSIFHRSEFLRAIAAETEMELEFLVGKNGEHPIGILPIFSDSKGPLRMVFSPPPHAGIPHLGPGMMLDPNIKYRKAALRTKEFVEACVNWIDHKHDPHYIRIICNTEFQEVRPFRWLGFDVTPQFTYNLDIDREESDLLQSFSRDARSSIQDHYNPECAIADGGQQLVKNESDLKYTIKSGGEAEIEYLADRLEQRFDEQGKEFPLSASFLRTIYNDIPDETIDVYQLQTDGKPVSGRISLFYDGRLTYWQGVPKPSIDIDIPINDLLNWRSICRAQELGCNTAELSGANIERLWDYKAKFNPGLDSYYILERTSTSTAPLLKMYKWWQT